MGDWPAPCLPRCLLRKSFFGYPASERRSTMPPCKNKVSPKCEIDFARCWGRWKQTELSRSIFTATKSLRLRPHSLANEEGWFASLITHAGSRIRHGQYFWRGGPGRASFRVRIDEKRFAQQTARQAWSRPVPPRQKYCPCRMRRDEDFLMRLSSPPHARPLFSI
jgi:hypothetical protein